MNIYDYPVTFLHDVQRTFATIRNEVESNSDKVRIVHDEELKIIVEHLDFTSNFSFTISEPKLENGVAQFNIIFTPKGLNATGTGTSKTFSKNNQVLNLFNLWVKAINYYESINIHLNSNVLKSYHKKFFESFQFIKDKNDEEPLEPVIQKQISKFITLLIDEFKNDDKIDEEILKELSNLRDCIPQLTQAQIKN